MEDLLDRGGPARADRARPAGQEPAARARWAREPFEVDALVDEAAGWGERLRDHLDDTTWLVQDALGPRRARPARGRPGHAPRPRPRQLPVRDLVEPGRRRRLHRRRHRAAPGRRGHRRHEGLLDARRLRAVSRPSSTTRSARGSPSAATSSGPSTGRPRRVGWFDAVPLRYAVAVNSVSCIMLNKLDILSGHRDRSACASPTRSTAGGSRPGRRAAPALARATPIYEDVPRLGRADPRRPLAGRPARERPPLRQRASRSTPACRSSSCRSGRSGPRRSSGPGGRCATGRAMRGDERREPLMPTRILDRRRRRARARARLEARRASRASTRSSSRPGAPPSRAEPRVRVRRRSTRSIPARSWPWPGARRPSSSSSGRRRRWRPASPTRSSRPGIAVFGPIAGGRADRDAARRSATRSRPRPGVRMARAGAFADAGAGARLRARARAAGGGGVVVKADGLAAGKGVTVCDDVAAQAASTRSRAALAGRHGAVRRRRGAARTAARRASSRCATAATPWPCRSPATTSGSATATRARTPAGWAPTARSRTCPTTTVAGAARGVPPADPRRAGPARDPVPWRALRRA